MYPLKAGSYYDAGTVSVVNVANVVGESIFSLESIFSIVDVKFLDNDWLNAD